MITLIQIPAPSPSEISAASDYEHSITHRFSELPLSIDIANKKFILLGAILFSPPVIPSELGHYVTAIKLNDIWEVYDDLRKKTYELNKESHVCFNILLYIEEEFE